MTTALIFLLLCITGGFTQQGTQSQNSLPQSLSRYLISSVSVIAQNLIGNGAFEKLGSLRWPSKFSTVQGWSANVFEIGPGRIYNNNWGSGINVAELAVNNNVDYRLPLRMGIGNYYLSFDWAARDGVNFISSQIELRWNGVFFLRLKPDDSLVFAQSMAFKSDGRKNTLMFTGAGTDDTLGATISNVKVHKALNILKDSFIFYETYVLQNIFFGESFYVRNNGEYLISFDFTPHSNSQLNNCQFTVELNGQKLLKFNPNTYDSRREFVRAPVRKGRSTLQFLDRGLQDVQCVKIDASVYRIPEFARKPQPSSLKLLNQIDRTENSNTDRSSQIGKLVLRVISENLAFNSELQQRNPYEIVENKVKLPNPEFTAPGNRYNEKWGIKNVALLDSKKQTVYVIPLTLPDGVYSLTFDWAPQSYRPLSTSQIRLEWNLTEATYLQANDYGIYTEKFLFIRNKKNYFVRLTGFGGYREGDASTITNVRINRVERSQRYYINQQSALAKTKILRYQSCNERSYIWNGGLTVRPYYFIQGTRYFTGRSLPSWTVDKKGQFGQGITYNSNWDRYANVIELDSDENVQYTAQFESQKPTFILSFDFAPCENKPFETSEISVDYNENFLFNIVPNTYEVLRQFVVIKSRPGMNRLTFKGKGASDGAGAAIGNVEMQTEEQF